MKTNLEPWKTMKTKWNYENHENQPVTMKNHENQPETMKNQSRNKQKHYKHNLPIIYRFDTFTRLIREKKWHKIRTFAV